MITDLKKIRELGIQNEDKNYRFRSFLKMKDPEKIDKIVHQLNQEYASKIDCTQGGNCCSELSPLVDADDVEKLSVSIGMSLAEFKKKYTKKDEDGDLCLNLIPCSFLKDMKCTVYNARPKECISYPHLHKSDFTSRLLGVIHNYSICPIVFNVYEDLKNRMNFR